MLEIPNVRELTRIAVEIRPSGNGHHALRDALCRRYPSLAFSPVILQSARFGAEMVVDGNLRRIADDLRGFLESGVIEHGSPRELWLSLSHSGLMVSRQRYTPIYFVARFGDGNRDYFQFQFVERQEEASHSLFCTDHLPRALMDVDSLVFDWRGPALPDPVPVGQGAYEFRSAYRIPMLLQRCLESEETEIQERDAAFRCAASYSEEESPLHFPVLPSLPSRAPVDALGRFFRDWEESSAGIGGHLLSDHWFIMPIERTLGGEHRLLVKGIPFWRGKAPEIPPHCYLSSSDDLWGYLRDFDSLAGYPFAWFFFMVHGVKIRPEVGLDVLSRVQRGEIILPNADHVALERWGYSTYTFDGTDFLHVR